MFEHRRKLKAEHDARKDANAKARRIWSKVLAVAKQNLKVREKNAIKEDESVFRD